MRKVSRDCVSGLSLARALVEIADFYLLVVTAFGTREGTYLSRAVSGHDGGLVPVEDVAARLTLLPEGNDRAALAYDLATCHLYRHSASESVTLTLPLYARSGLRIGNKMVRIAS